MIQQNLEQIVAGLQEAIADAGKFDDGNAAAGRRVRKAAQQARVALFELRKEVSEVQNSR
ncbi:MAG: histone H1 [Chlamydiota bacterium]|nr:histone H1 [Chlamydiota bacterium]